MVTFSAQMSFSFNVSGENISKMTSLFAGVESRRSVEPGDRGFRDGRFAERDGHGVEEDHQLAGKLT
jgi:hypothetical protein